MPHAGRLAGRCCGSLAALFFEVVSPVKSLMKNGFEQAAATDSPFFELGFELIALDQQFVNLCKNAMLFGERGQNGAQRMNIIQVEARLTCTIGTLDQFVAAN